MFDSQSQNINLEEILTEFDNSWIKTLKQLWEVKLHIPENGQEDEDCPIVIKPVSVQDFDKDKHDGSPSSFMAFNFDKAQDIYLQNQRYIESSNDLQNLVAAFKARIDELNENIDEDFMLNITEKVIPEHEEKINEFFVQVESYLKNLDNKAEQRAYYLENYVYKRHA